VALLIVIAGCEDSKKKTAIQTHGRATLNKTTQNVLKLEDALKDGGEVVENKISVSDPLTQSAEAVKYVGAAGADMAVKNKIGVRNALNAMEDPKPYAYDRFMSEIVEPGKPDGLNFQQLPYYQEYAWDEANQKIVIVEFPKKKEAAKKALDKELGRD
jgi:hypothetical protein